MRVLISSFRCIVDLTCVCSFISFKPCIVMCLFVRVCVCACLSISVCVCVFVLMYVFTGLCMIVPLRGFSSVSVSVFVVMTVAWSTQTMQMLRINVENSQYHNLCTFG